MRTFPVIRKTRLSNEHIMAGVFGVTLLYLLPSWIHSSAEILSYILVLITALFVDVAANYIRFKRPVCAVSAVMTAGILQVLTPGVPLWGRLLGITIALIFGKHVWGGTGKNIVNPAIVGVLFLSLVFKLNLPLWAGSSWLWIALVLSLPFVLFRPFAAIGLMAGMALSLLLHQQLSVATFISYGIIFWGSLVVTDPVTTTSVPSAGLIGGFLVGFLPLCFTNSVAVMALTFLLADLAWYIYGVKSPIINGFGFTRPLKIKKLTPYNEGKIDFLDLTGLGSSSPENIELPSPQEILNRIQTSGVFGFGGAAFPTDKKIRSVMDAGVSDKYFIINGVECDPGLLHDQWLIRRFPDEIGKGIEAICRYISFKKVILAVKDQGGLQSFKNTEIIKVPDTYPAGAEKLLIGKVLQKELATDEVPAKKGILVLNIQTIYAIYEAVYLNRQAETRYLTVANLKTKVGRVVKVNLGERVATILERLNLNSNMFFCGGGAMQSHLAEEGEVVGELTNFIAMADFPRYKESPFCSHCGLCVEHCPAELSVNKIAELVSAGHIEATLKYHPERCMKCGSCSYVCLAGRNLSAKVGEAADYGKSKIGTRQPKDAEPYR